MHLRTRNILYHLLPIVFWLLAIGVCVLYKVYYGSDLFHFIPAVIGVLVWLIISRIKRHSSGVEECFQMGFLIGIASYWLPTIIFLCIPVWMYLVYKRLFSFRVLCATLLGLVVVAIYSSISIWMGWLDASPWLHFFAADLTYGWIPTGSVLLAYLFSTIARRNLRER